MAESIRQFKMGWDNACSALERFRTTGNIAPVESALYELWDGIELERGGDNVSPLTYLTQAFLAEDFRKFSMHFQNPEFAPLGERMMQIFTAVAAENESLSIEIDQNSQTAEAIMRHLRVVKEGKGIGKNPEAADLAEELFEALSKKKQESPTATAIAYPISGEHRPSEDPKWLGDLWEAMQVLRSEVRGITKLKSKQEAYSRIKKSLEYITVFFEEWRGDKLRQDTEPINAYKEVREECLKTLETVARLIINRRTPTGLEIYKEYPDTLFKAYAALLPAVTGPLKETTAYKKEHLQRGMNWRRLAYAWARNWGVRNRPARDHAPMDLSGFLAAISDMTLDERVEQMKNIEHIKRAFGNASYAARG